MGWGVHRHQAPVSWFPEFSPLQSLLKTWNTPLMTHPLTSDLRWKLPVGAGNFIDSKVPFPPEMDGCIKPRRLYIWDEATQPPGMLYKIL